MKKLNRSRIIRNKHLLFISSIKPYFLTNQTKKGIIKTSIGTQCDKFDNKKEISDSWDYFKVTGVVHENLLKKLVTRPMSPVTIPVKCANYVAASKKKLERLHKSYDFSNYTNTSLIETNREINPRSRINTSHEIISKRKSFKCSRKTIKFSKSPELVECASNFSFDYFPPRYQG